MTGAPCSLPDCQSFRFPGVGCQRGRHQFAAAGAEGITSTSLAVNAMRIARRSLSFILPVLVLPATLAACAVAPPSGPDIVAMPGKGKSLAAFQQDDMACRNYASQSSGGTATAQAASQNATGTAIAGTAIGAAAGAALGSLSGNLGAGAAIGGATGLLAGSAIGASNAQASAGDLQFRYDTAYAQCMASRGDSVRPPSPGYAAYPAPYGYPYPAYYPPPVYAGPPVVVGYGWGWGPRWGWGWRGGYWRR